MEYIYKDFAKIVKKNHDELRKIFSEVGTNCYRIYDRNLEEIPVVVEKFADRIIIRTETLAQNRQARELDRDRILDITARMTYSSINDVFFADASALEFDQQSDKQDTQAETQYFSERGNTCMQPMTVKVEEMGLSYRVSIDQYGFTDFPLHSSVIRDLLRNIAFGKRTLILFSGSGHFTVSAASGAALETVSIDRSIDSETHEVKTADRTDRGEAEQKVEEVEPARQKNLSREQKLLENLALNKLSAPVHTFREGDPENILNKNSGLGRFHNILIDFSRQPKVPLIPLIRSALDSLASGGTLLVYAQNQTAKKILQKKDEAEETQIQNITAQIIPPGFTAKRFPFSLITIQVKEKPKKRKKKKKARKK